MSEATCKKVIKLKGRGTLKTEEIQLIIEDRIISGEMKPGSKINEKAIADEFEISRGPVREALNALKQEGLIELIPNRGGFVNSLSLKEAMELYDVRAGLAHTAGRLLPNCISDEQINELKDMHSQMVRLISENDLKAFYRVNEKFHNLLFLATGNAALIEMHQIIERRLCLYLQKEMRNSSILKKSNQHLSEIVEKISNVDPEGAATAFENHILIGKQRIFEISS